MNYIILFCSDGKITTEELIGAIRKLQNAPSEAKCRKIADMLDQDKDGALDLDDVETVGYKTINVIAILKRYQIIIPGDFPPLSARELANQRVFCSKLDISLFQFFYLINSSSCTK
jgi:hypothetical protein